MDVFFLEIRPVVLLTFSVSLAKVIPVRWCKYGHFLYIILVRSVLWQRLASLIRNKSESLFVTHPSRFWSLRRFSKKTMVRSKVAVVPCLDDAVEQHYLGDANLAVGYAAAAAAAAAVIMFYPLFSLQNERFRNRSE
jgi:hypothetical protein